MLSVSPLLQPLQQLGRFAEGQVYRSYDRTLLMTMLLLMFTGFIMVASASMAESARLYDDPYRILIKHSIFLCISLVIGSGILLLPIKFWKTYNGFLLLASFILLVLVLFVGRTVNGSTRWLSLGFFNIQAAEPAKLFFFAYLAGYLVRRQSEIKDNIKGFIKPLVVFFFMALLLLLQPDLGTIIVMFVTTVSLLFLAGARIWQFIALISMGIAAFSLLIITSPYRMRRITGFLDPWQDPFGHGYQLTQSLMAYGRGHIFGQGLGNSIQKIDYLPEAHTDFIFAIVAEELGLIGVLIIISLMLIYILRIIYIAQRAARCHAAFEAYFAFAIAIWFAFQSVVNLGASVGLLPTKGLTFPFISYGGSSLIIMTIAGCILLRLDHELRLSCRQTLPGGTHDSKK